MENIFIKARHSSWINWLCIIEDATAFSSVFSFFGTVETRLSEIIMKHIIAIVQILTMIWLVALAFPQRDFQWSSEILDNFDNTLSSTTQRTTTNCPCIATAEYNPICGSDNVTYWNMGRFNCAKNCNPRLEVKVIRACEPYSQLSSSWTVHYHFHDWENDTIYECR